MMTLKTNSLKTSTNSALVQWGVTENKNGILHVSLDFEPEDPALICELVAIKHLIFEKQIFDRLPKSGKGYKLVVSKGAIKKLVQGKSDKKYASKFMTFITSGFMSGVEIEVSQKKFPLSPTVPVPLEAMKAEYSMDFEFIETPSMGKIAVASHAIQRYQERITSGKPKNTWSSLYTRLTNPELAKRILDKKVMDHKTRKYGEDNHVEVWAHPDSNFCFLFIRVKETDCPVLISCFERNESTEKYRGAFA